MRIRWIRRVPRFGVFLLGLALPAQDLTAPRVIEKAGSTRLEQLLRKQVGFVISDLKTTPIPNELENAIRPLTATALSAAVCWRFDVCAGMPELGAAVERILTEVVRTHVTGGGLTASGRAWGHQWQSALWAWQAAFAAWLVADRLPAGLRHGVVRMMADEADRFLDLPAPYAEHYDTKAEENAWNSLILVLASQTQAGHPHRERWRQRALEYMISAFATRSDHQSSRRVDGRPLRDWIRGVNLHSDYTLENHGFVHPDYMTTTSLNLMNYITWRLAGAPEPAAGRHHAAEVYENLKWLTLPDGGLLYINGTDWNLHRIDMTASLHVQMERIMGDREAGALAAIALDTLERMQARNPSGRTFVPGEFPSYPGHEPQAAWLYAVALMSERLWDAPADARPIDAVWKRLQGPRRFDDGRFFVQRSPNGVSSFSWGLRVLGQTVPFRPDSVLNPINRSYVGLSRAPEDSGARAGRLGTGSVALERALASDVVSISTVIPGEENGAPHVTANVRHGDARQVFSFTALPTGESIYLERWEGGRALGGLVSLLEEEGWVYGPGKRAVRTDGRTWLHTEGLGFAVSQGGGIRTIPDVRNQLVVLNDAPKDDAAIATLPGATLEATQRFAASPWRLRVRHRDAAAVRAGEWMVVTNFSPHHATFDVETDGDTLAIPVSGYSTRVLRAPGRK